jgi:predicted membrane protein
MTMTMLLSSAVALILVGIGLWIINRYFPVIGKTKTVINVVLSLIVIGIVLWLINTYIPMAESIKAILNIFVVFATCVGVLQAVGVWSEIIRLWDNFTTHLISTDKHADETERTLSGV